MSIYKNFVNEINKYINLEYLKLSSLGNIEDDEIYLIQPKNFNYDLKSILIVASFHGDEIAPVYSILDYIKNFNYDILTKVNVSFIPVVNVSGFKYIKRYNKWNEISNYGYCLDKKILSKEGKILIDNDDIIKKLSINGFLTMHEDHESENGYLYVLSKKLDSVIYNIRDIIKNNVGIIDDKTYNTKYDDMNTVKDGLIINHLDGTYENYLFNNNIEICLTSETPAKNVNLKIRIHTNIEIIDTFINSYL